MVPGTLSRFRRGDGAVLPIHDDQRCRRRASYMWATRERGVEGQDAGIGAHEPPGAVGRAVLLPKISRYLPKIHCPRLTRRSAAPSNGMPPMSCAHHVRTAHALTGHDRSTMSSSSTPRSTTEKGALAPEPVKVVRVPPFALLSYNANIETRSRGGGVSLSSGGRAVSAPLRYSAAGGGRSTRFRTKRRAFFVMVSLAGRRRRSVVRSQKCTYLNQRGRQLSRPPYKIHFHFSYHDAPRPHGVLRPLPAACACPMDSIAPLPGIGRPKFNLRARRIEFPAHSSAGPCQLRRHFCCAIAWRWK